ncbi:hypothetical protein ACFXKG_08200 [Streptomyces sp. NPDC059255]|uniref:hypothetical protein n=1 Tax=Streptomyces sp. NPDC059255 TaxID=3346793 RepID=UPI003673942A
MRTALLALRATGVVTVLVAAPVLGTATTAQAHDGVRVTVIPSTAAPGDQVEIRAEGCKGLEAVGVSPVFANDVNLAPRAYGEDWIRDQAEAARNPDFKVPLSGLVRVKASATGGRQEIDIRCDGHNHPGSGSFDVVARNRPDPARPDPGKPDPGRADQQRPGQDRGDDGRRDREGGDHNRGDQDRRDKDRRDKDGRDHDRREPWAPVRAGGGGTAQLAADAQPAADTRPADARPAGRSEEHEPAGTAGPGTSHAVIGLVLTGVAAVAVAFRSVRRQRTAAGRDAN